MSADSGHGRNRCAAGFGGLVSNGGGGEQGVRGMRWIVRIAMLGVLALAGPAAAAVYNVRVVSDSRPDFTDMDSLIRSATGAYPTTDEKCRAMWQWLTRCRRQTPQPVLHGTPVHDPIMFYNDFGYSFCSDYAAINDGIWQAMGLPVRLWDITAHTVSECFYDGRWHLFDNSLSAYYTLCDGKTVAGVEDVGKVGACEASGGKAEPGHIAKHHCAAGTSANGFLSGCDTQRSLVEEGEYVFNVNRLKYRNYYNGFELGHRYVLNLRENESYTRYAKPLGTTKEYYLPLAEDGGSPQDLGTFGNGEWIYRPDLTKESTRTDADEAQNVAFTAEGLRATGAEGEAMVSFRIDAANIVTSAVVTIDLDLTRPGDQVNVVVTGPGRESQTSGWATHGGPERVVKTEKFTGVAGEHQYTVSLWLRGRPIVHRLEIHTITQLNKLALPALTLGRNTIDVVAGEQLGTADLWPELQRNVFAETAYQRENVASGEASDWHGCLWLEEPGTGELTYAMDTPGEMATLTYGGRFYNRAPGSSITLEHSFDDGKTWTKQWTLSDVEPPWDTVHFETVAAPAGVKRALVRYTLHSPVAGSYEGCSIYSIRATATYRPRNARFEPMEVTYDWSELHDGKWVERTHTQLVTSPKQRYSIDVSGEDLPRLQWVRIEGPGAARPATQAAVAVGVADLATRGQGPGTAGIEESKSRGVEEAEGKATAGKGEGAAGRRVRHIWGRDLALGKRYAFSVPSGDDWDGGDAEMTKLTDGVVASTYGGGTTYRWGPIWAPNQNPAITLDLGAPRQVAAARIHVTGYPYDLYNGPFCTIEVLTSMDGKEFQSQGSFQTKVRAVDLDGDFLNQERGGFESLVFPLILKQPVTARYVQYRVTNPEMFFDTSEVMVYDSVRVEEWREPLVMPLD